MESVNSEIVEIERPENLNTEFIENLLKDKFGDVVRWAIIKADNNKLRIEAAYRA